MAYLSLGNMNRSRSPSRVRGEDPDYIFVKVELIELLHRLNLSLRLLSSPLFLPIHQPDQLCFDGLKAVIVDFLRSLTGWWLRRRDFYFAWNFVILIVASPVCHLIKRLMFSVTETENAWNYLPPGPNGPRLRSCAQVFSRIG